jgi:hypothetical protein
MYQTSYKSLEGIARIKGSYIGGFCKWWYTPIENIASFPAVNPVTQLLNSEPVLQAGKTWYGPITVPESKTGWKEDPQRTKPGISYKQRVEGFNPGLSANNHINLENLIHHQVCIVGKVRSGGFYIILGNDQAGLDIDHNETSGIGSAGMPGTELVFTGEFKNKALILPSFTH